MIVAPPIPWARPIFISAFSLFGGPFLGHYDGRRADLTELLNAVESVKSGDFMVKNAVESVKSPDFMEFGARSSPGSGAAAWSSEVNARLDNGDMIVIDDDGNLVRSSE